MAGDPSSGKTGSPGQLVALQKEIEANSDTAIIEADPAFASKSQTGTASSDAAEAEYQRAMLEGQVRQYILIGSVLNAKKVSRKESRVVREKQSRKGTTF